MSSPRPFELNTATNSAVLPKAFSTSTVAPAFSRADAAESENCWAAKWRGVRDLVRPAHRAIRHPLGESQWRTRRRPSRQCEVGNALLGSWLLLGTDLRFVLVAHVRSRILDLIEIGIVHVGVEFFFGPAQGLIGVRGRWSPLR